MDIKALAAELSADPLIRGYISMSAQEAANSLNSVDIVVNKTAISGDDAFAATDTAQWGTLSDAHRQLWLAFCARPSIDPFGGANVAFVQWVFGAGSATVINLGVLRTYKISRAAQLNILGNSRAVTAEHITAARAV